MILKYNVDIPTENRTRKQRITYSKDIVALLKSGQKNCEVEVPSGSNYQSIAINYRSSVSRLGLSADIAVLQRDFRIFLKRKEETA